MTDVDDQSPEAQRAAAEAARADASARKTRTSKRGGRHSKLTQERIDEIAVAIRAGNYAKVAAERAGVSEGTFFWWKRQGKEAADVIDEILGDDTLTEDEAVAKVAEFRAGLAPLQSACLDLFEAVVAAEAESEMRLVTNWSIAAQQDWRAARDLLARRHPDRWKEHKATELSSNPDRPLAVSVRLSDIATAVHNSPEALAGALSALEAIAPLFGDAQAAPVGALTDEPELSDDDDDEGDELDDSGAPDG